MTLPEVDNRIRSRNTRDGIRRALKEGHYPYGMPPKGYSKDKSHAKTSLLVPNEEAPLVSEALKFLVLDCIQLKTSENFIGKRDSN